MYRHKIGALPRKIKQELINAAYDPDIDSTDDLISYENVKSRKFDFDEVVKALNQLELPDFWIVTSKDSTNGYSYYFVFIRKLTPFEGYLFFNRMISFGFLNEVDGVDDTICRESWSKKYSIF